jgi:hypothetical protein
VAQNSSFNLRMIKFAVNQMQDTMGFSTAVRATLDTYYTGSIARQAQQETVSSQGTRFLADAGRAMKNLEEWRRWQR